MQNKINKRTTPIAVMIGIGIILLFASALTAVITTLIANGTVRMEMLKYCIPVVQAVSVYVGCVISKLMCSQKRLLTAFCFNSSLADSILIAAIKEPT